MARAMPVGNIVTSVKSTMNDSPFVISESMAMARKRLPAPAGSRRILTCSGVVIVASRITCLGGGMEQGTRRRWCSRDDKQLRPAPCARPPDSFLAYPTHEQVRHQ